MVFFYIKVVLPKNLDKREDKAVSEKKKSFRELMDEENQEMIKKGKRILDETLKEDPIESLQKKIQHMKWEDMARREEINRSS